ncbi:hypothetical protein CRUP_016786 [Coryphaenoides rupestris]|nr:hypothetical protein CRUP_016786 [Coryphaenoides rupestris]
MRRPAQPKDPVGLYHDYHPDEGVSSKENRMIFSESMPRRVGSFYRVPSPRPDNSSSFHDAMGQGRGPVIPGGPGDPVAMANHPKRQTAFDWSAAEAMVMSPPEPAKEKEKQGFFRAMKKKKKKAHIADVEEGRSPGIRKSLFPLFSSKNSLKHSAAVAKALPVVASPMVSDNGQEHLSLQRGSKSSSHHSGRRKTRERSRDRDRDPSRTERGSGTAEGERGREQASGQQRSQRTPTPRANH